MEELKELIREEQTSLRILIEKLTGYVDTLSKVVDDHEKRIRYLERVVFLGLGGSGVVLWLLNKFAV